MDYVTHSTATLISNLMPPQPQGNPGSQIQMPDCFDDWDNIPGEAADDPPDIKAFKRFLFFAGDLDYRRSRLKMIPLVW